VTRLPDPVNLPFRPLLLHDCPRIPPLLIGLPMFSRLLVGLLVLSIVGCNSKPETLITEEYDQAEMDAAIARARGEVDAFIAELNNPTGEDHAVKAPVQDGEATEHFWLTGVSFRDGKFHGTINNDPGIVSNVKFGQSWSLSKEEISDWMYMRDGKMYGNYTMRPLLKTLPDEEAAQYRAMLAEP
jgi:uncharacterized protein YegJ (DUF2314 family)